MEKRQVLETILTFYEMLGDGDQAENVRSEHGFDVGVRNVSHSFDSKHEASIIDCSSITKLISCLS